MLLVLHAQIQNKTELTMIKFKSEIQIKQVSGLVLQLIMIGIQLHAYAWC